MKRIEHPPPRPRKSRVRWFAQSILLAVLAFFVASELWERLVSPVGAEEAGRFALFFVGCMALMRSDPPEIPGPTTWTPQVALALAAAEATTAVRWAIFH